MQITDLTFEIRDASFNKVAMLQPGDGLTSLKATLRFNNVGSWEIAIPAGTNADLLRTPGFGLVCTGPSGVLFSGPTVAATAVKDSENPKGVWSIRGATDAIVLGEHLAYPTPSTANVAAQTSAYDSQSGVASSVMYGYVQRNLVSGTAPAARAVSGLSIATDTAIGSTVVYNARFQKLGDLLSTLAAVSNPQLGFDIKQVGTGIVFSVYQPADKSGLVRMDAANGTLQKVQYGYGYGATRAIVGGMGQLTARQFVEVSNTSAESQWARRVEVFVDQNNESDTTKLTQYGKDKLAEGGSITSIEVTPSSDLVMEYGVDWNLGDTVSVIIDSQQVSAIVSQATITVAEDGVRVGATVGQPSGFDFDSILMKRQVDQSSDISTLQLKETGGTATLVPAGGAANTVLAKTSATDYATGWTQIADANVSASAGIANSKLAASGVTAGTYPKVTVNDRGIVTGASTSVANSDLANSSITINGTAVSLGGTRTVSASELTSGTLPMAQGGSGGTTGSGLVPVIPSSVAVGSGSASVSSAGAVTFTGVSTVSLNGIFSSAYTSYRFIVRGYTNTASGFYGFRLRASGTDNSASYNYGGWQDTPGTTTLGAFTSGGVAYAGLAYMNSAAGGPATAVTDIHDVTIAQYSTWQSSSIGTSGTTVLAAGSAGIHFVASAYDGLTLFASTGTFTGTVSVYGYRS